MLLDIVWRNIPKSFFKFNADKPDKNGKTLVKVKLVQNQSQLQDINAMAEKNQQQQIFKLII